MKMVLGGVVAGLLFVVGLALGMSSSMGELLQPETGKIYYLAAVGYAEGKYYVVETDPTVSVAGHRYLLRSIMKDLAFLYDGKKFVPVKIGDE